LMEELEMDHVFVIPGSQEHNVRNANQGFMVLIVYHVIVMSMVLLLVMIQN